jgi:hypothetical protein
MKINPLPFKNKALKFKRENGTLVVGGRIIAERFPVTYITPEAAPGYKNIGAPRREKRDIGMPPHVVAERMALIDSEDKAFGQMVEASKLAALEFAVRMAPERMKDHRAGVNLLRHDGTSIGIGSVIIELP